jgi:hypothetical protein
MGKYNKKILNRICSLIEKDSYTIAEICEKVSISERCYYDWQKNNAEFAAAIARARDKFDEMLIKEAKESLRKKIMGYDVEETKTVIVEGKDGKPKVKEQTKIKKHFQPDTAAIQFFLTNKAGEEFKNKQSTELTGKDGKDLIPDIKVEVIDKREQVENSND